MTILVSSPTFDDVFQLEQETVALGGAGAVMNAQAQSLANRTEWLRRNKGSVAQYALPNTLTSAQWVKIGTFTAPQVGAVLALRLYLHSAYTASIDQDQIISIFFKTSNGTAVNGAGFAGSCFWFSQGRASAVPSNGVKWKANAAGTAASAFDLYVLFPANSSGCHFEFAAGEYSFANVGSIGEADPGADGATVLIATPDLTFTTAPSMPTAAPGTNTTQGASTAFVQAAIAPLAPKDSPTFTGTVVVPTPAAGDTSTKAINGAFLYDNVYSHKHSALGNRSGTVSINVGTTNYVSLTATGSITFALTGAIGSDRYNSLTMELTNGGNFAITWPSYVKWQGGIAPSLTSGGVDVLIFITDDGGATWRGTLSMKDSR